MTYRNIITFEPGKRSGQPCIRGLRITVYDVLSYLASGMSAEEILEDFPMLTREDILACLAFAAEKQPHKNVSFTVLKTNGKHFKFNREEANVR